MENEKDLILFVDEDGAEYEMEIVDYFEYDGEEFAMLIEANDDHEHDGECDECGCECQETDVYIMQVIVDGETGEELFMPIEDEKLDEIVDALDQFFEEYDDFDEDFDFEDDEEEE